MEIRDLNDYKNQLNNLQIQIDKLNNQLNDLNDEPLIIRYSKLNNILRNLESDKSRLQQEYRYHHCEHPLWYLETVEYDREEEKTYWTCTCVACEVRKEAQTTEFENVVTGFDNHSDMGINKYTFDEVKNAYAELYGTGKIQESLAGKVLVKKFEVK